MVKIRKAWATIRTNINAAEEVPFTPWISEKTKKQNLLIAGSLGSYHTRSKGHLPIL
jgi:hypothetical protein